MYDMTGFDYDISDVVNLLKLQVRHKNYCLSGCEHALFVGKQKER